MKSNYERLKEIETRIEILKLVITEAESTPHLCLSKKLLRDMDYYAGISTNGRKTGGTIQIIDLPTDLGLRELVIKKINNEIDSLQEEFDSYTINK